MKNITFDHLTLRNQKLNFALLILAMLFLILYSFKPFGFISNKAYQIMFSMVFLIQIFTNAKILWYKNFVQWNKKGINIKLNDFFGKNYKFDEIAQMSFSEQKLLITKSNGQKTVFELNDYDPESVNKLIEILKVNTGIKPL